MQLPVHMISEGGGGVCKCEGVKCEVSESRYVWNAGPRQVGIIWFWSLQKSVIRLGQACPMTSHWVLALLHLR